MGFEQIPRVFTHAPMRRYAERMFTRTARSSPRFRALRWLTAVLLLVWAVASFGVSYFARALSFVWGDWPFSFWFAAQGCVLVFLGITVVYAVLANRWDSESNRQDLMSGESPPESAAPPAKPVL
jgi:putative solute:sodium symporter small subunit